MIGWLGWQRAQKKAALLLALVASDASAQELRARARRLPVGGRRLGFFAPYPLLRELEADSYVLSYESEPVAARGSRPRRYYQLTEAGRWLLEERRDAVLATLAGRLGEPTGAWRMALADDPRLAALGGVVAGVVLTTTVKGAVGAWPHAWPVALVFFGVVVWVLRRAVQRFDRLRRVLEPAVQPLGWGPTRQLYLLPNDPGFVERLEAIVEAPPEHSGSPAVHAGTACDSRAVPAQHTAASGAA